MTGSPPSGDSAVSQTGWRRIRVDFALRGLYRQEFDRIRRDFEATGSGLESLSDRTRQVDRLVLTLWEQYLSAVLVQGTR